MVVLLDFELSHFYAADALVVGCKIELNRSLLVDGDAGLGENEFSAMAGVVGESAIALPVKGNVTRERDVAEGQTNEGLQSLGVEVFCGEGGGVGLGRG